MVAPVMKSEDGRPKEEAGKLRDSRKQSPFEAVVTSLAGTPDDARQLLLMVQQMSVMLRAGLLGGEERDSLRTLIEQIRPQSDGDSALGAALAELEEQLDPESVD